MRRPEEQRVEAHVHAEQVFRERSHADEENERPAQPCDPPARH